MTAVILNLTMFGLAVLGLLAFLVTVTLLHRPCHRCGRRVRLERPRLPPLRLRVRPGCPARTPKRENVRYYRTAAAARRDGFRACLRCHPDRFIYVKARP